MTGDYLVVFVDQDRIGKTEILNSCRDPA